MSDLTILCVTRFGKHAEPFLEYLYLTAEQLGARLVLAADGTTIPAPGNAKVIAVESRGYIESVLDDAIDACPDGYILRLDDDERPSPRMVDWLKAGSYRDADHWAFPRLNLWPDEKHHIVNRPLWPDLQTRLSVKAKAGGRTMIHQGSPHGTGRVADVAIEHHKFLVRDRAEREALVEDYELRQRGAGQQYLPFSVPERFAADLLTRPVPR